MLTLLVVLSWATLGLAKCYEPTVAHPLPEYDANDLILRRAFAAINNAINIAVAAPEYAATSFSVEITSSKETLWSHHYTARERNTSRHDIPEVNGDALYRIASISKTFTVLGVLQQHEAGNLSLDSTIDQYIEELRHDQAGSIPWKDITLRSLASQLSGIPRDFAQTDVINKNFGPDPSELGLPPLSRKGLLNCDEFSDYEIPCQAPDLLHALREKSPIFAPNQISTYSNVAFELLGLAIARVTNKTYESYIDEAIFKPLNMTLSTFSTPKDSSGVIPLNPHYWGIDAGIQNPTGGIYSSSSELSKYLRYILTHYNSISHAANWLNPVSPTRGMTNFYGMPWEILHTDRVLLNSRRPVRFITKGGGLPGYTSVIMTVPEYDLGITILVAGNGSLFSEINEAVTVGVVRAAEEVAIRQLNERYDGTYVSSDPSLNSSLILESDHRGLLVKEFISNSTDVLKKFGLGLGGGNYPWYAQLVPTLLFRDEDNQKGERWRLLLSAERTREALGVWDDFCALDVDTISYAHLPINELVFWDSTEDGFARVELTGFRANLTRSGDDANDASEEQEMLEL